LLLALGARAVIRRTQTGLQLAPPHAALLAENAQRMRALADQGLAVVHEMMELEAATREAAGLEWWLCASEDHHTLEDACVALGTARHRATRALPPA